ncbi:hypothetical protein BDY17DRAFT_51015 [Neohortaea acidophila]|uniref:Uncharacterized protein n=1 Tax=Neohortaea acidophila TaxID=245834 RepID=A0A6A6PGR7_9PEZI|nr:uncharacterized protein BDY17DRAFT_51015 [Neohortaea acidophila]KAF2479179.1 hypothetical protein BDY17DRAFT_51015 [Neohortaea acidophila]
MLSTSILSLLLGVAGVAMALPTSDASLVKRAGPCRDPGEYTCAVITAASASSLGIMGTTVSGGGVSIVGGSCQNILYSGQLQDDSPGFSAQFVTTYGPTLYYGANFIGLSDIEGISFQYDGHSYTQANDCFSYNNDHFPYEESVVQCNFPC